MVTLSIDDITHVYNSGQSDSVLAVEDFNLNISDGEFVSLLGPSGCGKSTLLYIIAGFISPTEGRILVSDDEITGPGTDRGVIFQEYALFPWKTVLENVQFGVEHARSEKNSEEIARKYISQVGLDGFENSYPKELSGGMKQRVATARTIAYDPDILLMDEPFGSLDAQTREILQDEILEICEQSQKTVVFVTHSVEEAVYLSDRIAVMTAHPGTKKNVIDVNIDRNSSRQAIIESEGFMTASEQARTSVMAEISKSDMSM